MKKKDYQNPEMKVVEVKIQNILIPDSPGGGTESRSVSIDDDFSSRSFDD